MGNTLQGDVLVRDFNHGEVKRVSRVLGETVEQVLFDPNPASDDERATLIYKNHLQLLEEVFRTLEGRFVTADESESSGDAQRKLWHLKQVRKLIEKRAELVK